VNKDKSRSQPKPDGGSRRRIPGDIEPLPCMLSGVVYAFCMLFLHSNQLKASAKSNGTENRTKHKKSLFS
jgi:hypothetical protein